MSKESFHWSGFHGKYKHILLRAGIGLLNIVVAAVLGLVLLILVYKLPLENITGNVEKSALIIDSEGAYPQMFWWCTSQLDNYTDSTMLSESADDTDASAVNKALMAYRKVIAGKNPQESLTEHYICGEEYSETVSYARYWHGYLLFLKPLLEVMDYGKLRIINSIVQMAVFLVICLLMWKRRLEHLIIPYFICYLMLMPVTLAMSLQFSSCYYVASAGMILMLVLPEKKRNAYVWLAFLNIGIITAYFDFLTYPIATFGMPAALLLAITSQDKTEMKLRKMAGNGIAWCAGYGGMWFSKWVLTAVFTEYDIFDDAFNAFSFRVSRTVAAGESYSVVKCIIENYFTFVRTPFSIMALMVVLYFIVYIHKRYDKYIIGILVPYAVLALAPIVWYCFATNHSAIHSYFTSKGCVVSLMSAMFGLSECLVYVQNTRHLGQAGEGYI